MEYIGGPPQAGCLFCRVLQAPVAEDRANLVVWRPPGAVVLLNRDPYNPGHLLVAPAEHEGDLAALSQESSAALFSALQRSLRVLESALKPEGFNVGANLGRVAGAGIPDHVHLHVVPRWAGDTNFMPVVSEVKVVNEHLDRSWEKLSRAFAAS
jgi:ATP adenylyltransferase